MNATATNRCTYTNKQYRAHRSILANCPFQLCCGTSSPHPLLSLATERQAGPL